MNRFLPALLTLVAVLSTSLPAFSQSPKMTETDGRIFATGAGQQTEQEYELSDIDDTDEDLQSGEDDEPVQRVARITFIDGEVGFLRAGVSEWADAATNLPLLAGDQVYTEQGARIEIQLGRGNYIRLSENTALTIAELSHTTAQFEITEGIALIRLERYGSAFERFEVDTPNAALLLQQDGFYRINVSGEEESEVIVRNGLAEVTTSDGVFSLREGQRLMVETGERGRLEIVADWSRDEWDEWSHERDTTIDRGSISIAPTYVSEQETVNHCFYGASELSSYGTWTNYGSYGHCWVPRVASGWAPYRSGQWIWIPRAGWSWWSNEPWGWAPYHYGRWVYLNGLGWAWSPGIGSSYYRYGHSYYQWRPALVRFFNCSTPRGNYVGWYPLRPGERWRRHDRYRRDPSRLHYPGVNDGRNRPRSDRNRWNRRLAREGVTVIPGEGFARPDRNNSRPAAPDRDMDRWLKNGARAGLPGFTPTTSVTAPVARGFDGNPRMRPTARPSKEVLNRPVITRNKLVDPQIISTAPRERRLITPKKEKNSVGMPMPRGGNHNHNGDRADDTSRSRNEDQNSDERRERRRVVTTPVMPDSSGDQGSSSDRERRRRDNDADNRSERTSERKGSGSSAGSDEGKPRSRERIPFPQPRTDGDSNNRPRDNSERPRQKSNESAEPRQRRNESPPRNDRNSGGSSTPRNYHQPRQARPEPRQMQPAPRNENRDRGGARPSAPRKKG